MDNNFLGFFAQTAFEAYNDVIVIDVATMKASVMKFMLNPELEGKVVDAIMLDNMLKSSGMQLAEGKYLETSLKETFMDRCKKKQSGFLLNYRRTVDEKNLWGAIYLFVPNNFGEGENRVIFATVILDEIESIRNDIIRNAEKDILKVGRINAVENSTISIKLSYNEAANMKYYTGTSYQDEIEYVAKNLVHPDDRDIYLEHMNLSVIKKFYEDGYIDYGFLFRRKTTKLYEWVYIRISPVVSQVKSSDTYEYHLMSISESLLNYLSSTDYFTENHNKDLWDSEFEYSNYVSRIQIALFAFTYKYETFLEVDLKTSRYISFKSSVDARGTIFKHVGFYPEHAKEAIDNLYEGSDAEKLKGFIDLENIRGQLISNSTIHDNFRRKDGTLVSIIVGKTESIKGIPSKVNITSEVVNENTNQLKVVTFGNFEVYDANGNPIEFEKKQSKQVLAYLIDKVGYPISNADIVEDVLEKPIDDLNARKYASALVRKAMRDLENAGYPDVIIKEANHTRINKAAVDCDYYHLLDGNIYYWTLYHNEYMKEYSWAEETNSEITHYFDK